MNGSNGTFTVQGIHTYDVDSLDRSGGVYTVTVTVNGPQNEVITTTNGVSVVRPPVIGVGSNVAFVPGVAFSNVEVAAFSEPDVADPNSEFSTTIYWGDGSSSSGVVAGSNGLFRVLGGHSYASAGEFAVQIEVSQAWNSLQLVSVLTSEAFGADPKAADPTIQFYVKPISNNDAKPSDTLAVSYWKNAFVTDPNDPKKLRIDDSFIDKDTKAFTVVVTDPKIGNNQNTITADLKTSSDEGAAIELTRKANTNSFVSKNLILVTFAVDDQYKLFGVADNKPGDRSFLVKLGDTVTASYKQSKSEATVPVQKVLKLNVNIMGGNMNAKVVNDAIPNVSAVFAQIGIRVEATNITNNAIAPNGIYEKDGSFDPYLTGPVGKKGLTPQQRTLFGDQKLRTDAETTINVYVFPSLSGGVLGATFTPNQIMGLNEPAKFANSVVIALNPDTVNTFWDTLAHEIGHDLLNSRKGFDTDHSFPGANAANTNEVLLMTSPRKKVVNDEIVQGLGGLFERRRILPGTGSAMLKNNKALLTDPS